MTENQSVNQEAQSSLQDSGSIQKNHTAQDLTISHNEDEKDPSELFVTKSSNNAYLKSNSDTQKSRKEFWISQLNRAQFILRECSVVLILLETVILLLGYCFVLGLHLSIRYGYRYVRGKSDTQLDFHDDRLENLLQDEVNYQPVALPRGRMSRG